MLGKGQVSKQKIIKSIRTSTCRDKGQGAHPRDSQGRITGADTCGQGEGDPQSPAGLRGWAGGVRSGFKEAEMSVDKGETHSGGAAYRRGK